MPSNFWGYNRGVQGTGLMWVYPRRNVFEFPRGNFEQISFNDLLLSKNWNNQEISKVPPLSA